jgi:4-azaleucine resistance transporter AzlC
MRNHLRQSYGNVLDVATTVPDLPITAGLRRAIPLVLPSLALGISFGVLAEPVMGTWAPIVMSILVCSGGAQFAALGVLSANGAAGAAIGAGMLMNARWLPMSLAVAPSLRGRTGRRAVEAQAIVDSSFVLASRPDGTFDRGMLIGATLPQVSAWVVGTAIGVLGTGALDDPGAFGLDAIFPAFYLALLVEELGARRSRRVIAALALGGAITVVLLPIAPPGVPVIAACAAALLGLRR